MLYGKIWDNSLLSLLTDMMRFSMKILKNVEMTTYEILSNSRVMLISF